MGQEISTDRFTEADFTRFHDCLCQETNRLAEWFARSASSFPETPELVGGFELEACLLDRNCQPATINQSYLSQLDSDLVVEELASFNIEINTVPRTLESNCLSLMQADLDKTWQECVQAAQGLDARFLSIGILPTLQPEHLSLTNMSDRARYRALNQRLIHQRRARHIHIQIPDPHVNSSIAGPVGDFSFDSPNIMIEAAATSFQIHLQVPPSAALRYFNASTILAAPMVAVSANSPYLFGRNLWCETRIPLFEQIMTIDNPVDRGGQFPDTQDPISRVSLGRGYLKDSMMECFLENLENFSILLPEHLETGGDRFNHLRLHNGTIWRWNRPLIGFNADGSPHLRIEHRVVPAVTSVVDAIATAAFYFGLVHSLATQSIPPETRLIFEQAQANFYAAARQGLNAPCVWLDSSAMTMQQLSIEILMPLAYQGLTALRLDPADVECYLGVIQERISTGQTGAQWQQTFIRKHSADMRSLVSAYLDNQMTGHPVHQWLM
ncbi:MAG: glutamate-cysteine ligase family protein [Cyanobacteria bacterium J06555_12]